MSGDLRVTTAHLRELSAKQGQAAADLTSAAAAVEGVDSAVRWTHGPISWSTAAAVEAAQQARRTAGAGMANVCAQLGERLTSAADRYDSTDTAAGEVVDGTVEAR